MFCILYGTVMKVSRHPENIWMPVGHEKLAGHDLSYKIRFHQVSNLASEEFLSRYYLKIFHVILKVEEA